MMLRRPSSASCAGDPGVQREGHHRSELHTRQLAVKPPAPAFTSTDLTTARESFRGHRIPLCGASPGRRHTPGRRSSQWSAVCEEQPRLLRERFRIDVCFRLAIRGLLMALVFEPMTGL